LFTPLFFYAGESGQVDSAMQTPANIASCIICERTTTIVNPAERDGEFLQSESRRQTF
jgi:hypothetical protein